jgi:uncharacterized HAD superfamily protein
MKIAFDLDDILANFQTVWMKHNNENYGTDLHYEDLVDFQYSHFMGIDDKEVVRRIFEVYESQIFDTITPIAGAFQAVEAVKKSGHELCVLTSRVSELRPKTIAWINQHFPAMFDNIYFSEQMSREGINHKVTKADICKLENINLLIEDAPIYAGVVAAANIDVALVHKPWNAAFLDQYPYLHRLNTIGEVADLVKTLKP